MLSFFGHMRLPRLKRSLMIKIFICNAIIFYFVLYLFKLFLHVSIIVLRVLLSWHGTLVLFECFKHLFGYFSAHVLAFATSCLINIEFAGSAIMFLRLLLHPICHLKLRILHLLLYNFILLQFLISLYRLEYCPNNLWAFLLYTKRKGLNWTLIVLTIQGF